MYAMIANGRHGPGSDGLRRAPWVGRGRRSGRKQQCGRRPTSFSCLWKFCMLLLDSLGVGDVHIHHHTADQQQDLLGCEEE